MHINGETGKFGPELTTRYQVGVRVSSQSGPCRGLQGTVAVPLAWPEQQVKIVAEDISSGARVSYRQVAPTVKQMIVTVPYLPAGREAHALVTFELTRRSILPPTDVAGLSIPRTTPRAFLPYIGSSKGIEVRHAKIRSMAKQVVKDKETAWEKVEAIYDWVRENVEYKNGPFKGAAAAMRDGYGDCEELSSLFIAMCRVNKIPARTVWVPGHCYPEFYLVDAEGEGHWFPCQAAGGRAFGGIPEHRPILQKGDNFRVPERPRETLRYVAEYLTGKGGKPRVKFVRETLGTGAENNGLIN
ncbi:MAG: hypothetical protein N2C14_07580 [Planctomycetales bacterium]